MKLDEALALVGLLCFACESQAHESPRKEGGAGPVHGNPWIFRMGGSSSTGPH